MDKPIKWSPDKICRICLYESANMKSLSAKIEGEHRTLWDALGFVSNLTLNVANNLPKLVCITCEAMLSKTDAFKRRCVESETFLNRYANDSTISELELEIARKSYIKDEIMVETSNISNIIASPVPAVSKKSSNYAVSVDFDSILKKDEKYDVFNDYSLGSTSKDLISLSTERAESLSKDFPVKVEANNDLEANYDTDLENDNYDALPLETLKQKTITELKVYTCSCGNVYNNKDEYKTHLQETICSGYKKTMKIKMEKKRNGGRMIKIKQRIVCPECNLEFNSFKACKLHQKTHKEPIDPESLFQCTLCMRKFNRKSSYTNHMKNHDAKSNVKFTCDTCKREFQHKAHLDNHILSVHTRDKGYPCELCNTNFATQESLELHKESHKIEKKHTCKICNKAFYMLSTLNDHMRTHTGEKPFLCSICGRGFSQKTNLAQHMRRHQGLKPFKCEHCDRRFVSKGELVAHNRKHSGAHPFVCDDCGSGFTTSSSLVKHRRTHTGERPYACDLCPARFAASGTLKNHRRTHTGEKPFQCSYCEKAFVQRHDLISHIRCHTGERPYTCGCGQAFRKASALKAHVRMHGKEAPRDSVMQVNMLMGVSMPSDSLSGGTQV